MDKPHYIKDGVGLHRLDIINKSVVIIREHLVVAPAHLIKPEAHIYLAVLRLHRKHIGNSDLAHIGAYHLFIKHTIKLHPDRPVVSRRQIGIKPKALHPRIPYEAGVSEIIIINGSKFLQSAVILFLVIFILVVTVPVIIGIIVVVSILFMLCII